MNIREFKCVDILTDLIENHGMVSIKTSFEDEGAMFNEIVRLKQVCNEAKTKVVLKIGGPEAIRDIKESNIIGVKGIVAPMVESPFALHKYIQAINNNIPVDVISSLQIGVNLETITSVTNVNSILDIDDSNQLYGVTVGRVDLVASMGKDRDYVDSDEVYKLAKRVFIKTKEQGLKACIGGAVSVNSLDFLKKLNSEGLLDKFETRYAMFDASTALKNLHVALSKAQLFEYEWLKTKQEYYQTFVNQDANRIQMIQNRLNKSISSK
jgi:hypothetical protein